MTEWSATDQHILKITKKYILDHLNAQFFANTVIWDGIDQYNELPILYVTEDKSPKFEHRGALILSRDRPIALRLLATTVESYRQSICYRVTGIKKPIRIDDYRKIYYPLDHITIDFSIADLNLGVNEPSSYSFYDNTSPDGTAKNKKLFTFLKHLLSSYFIAFDKPSIFEDIMHDLLSFPPVTTDRHYLPIFGVQELETGDDI